MCWQEGFDRSHFGVVVNLIDPVANLKWEEITFPGSCPFQR